LAELEARGSLPQLVWPHRFRAARFMTPWFDRLLRLRPLLCSDIYMVGRKADNQAATRMLSS
jgi:hypothetical protein